MRNDSGRVPLAEPPFPMTSWRFLGEGAYALTYIGDLPSGRTVVVKELFPIGAVRLNGGRIRLPFHMRDIVERTFVREALNLESIKDPHVPSLIEVSSAANRRFEGNHYLILEAVEGEKLHNWFANFSLRDQSARVGEALSRCFADLAETLARLENSQLIHGDIAPANILVRADGTPVLIDFGSAFSELDPHLGREAAHPGYRMPGVTSVSAIGPRLDLFALCGSFYHVMAGRPPVDFERKRAPTLAVVFAGSPARAIGGTEDLVRAIDLGLAAVPDASAPAYDAAALARLVRASETPLMRTAPTSVINPWKLMRKETLMPPRYQSCLLQSFDTPRYREDDGAWLIMRDGRPLVTPTSQKLALARAEALLAICFGREILVPAGQIADSPGFQTIFTEIMAAYLPRRKEIAAAFARNKMPEWRPFRLGLERPDLKDYASFTQSYEYTGAPLVLLEITGGNVDREVLTRQLLEKAIELFNLGEFDKLGFLMETNAGRQQYGEFAQTVSRYFDESVSVHATPGLPEIGTSAYTQLFRNRLLRDDLTGIDPAEVEQIIGSVERINAILAEKKHVGLRGNWYLFREEFGPSWQLARAYLDFRLFMNLSRQYRIDHPILVSQAIEANRYSHSLMLGPRFSSDTDGSPARDTSLMRLAGRVHNRIRWDEVFSMFVDDRFIKSVRQMNGYYFDSEPDSADMYQTLVRAHGAFLGAQASDFLEVDVARGNVAAAPKIDTPASSEDALTMVGAVEGTMLMPDDSAAAAETFASGVNGMDEFDQAFAVAAVAPLDRYGAFNVGEDAADYMLNYYFKPYRLALSRGL